MEKRLAIKGHSTRGKEVIEILKMLGGKERTFGMFNVMFNGDAAFGWYYINEGGYIDFKESSLLFESLLFEANTNVFTLEEFLEEFPYKVGDRVRIPEYESEVRISSMNWDGCEVQYEVFTDEYEWYSANELNK